jgi:hypothetical protein
VKKDVKEGANKAAQRAKDDTAKVKAAAKETAAVAAEKAKQTGGRAWDGCLGFFSWGRGCR